MISCCVFQCLPRGMLGCSRPVQQHASSWEVIGGATRQGCWAALCHGHGPGQRSRGGSPGPRCWPAWARQIWLPGAEPFSSKPRAARVAGTMGAYDSTDLPQVFAGRIYDSRHGAYRAATEMLDARHHACRRLR